MLLRLRRETQPWLFSSYIDALSCSNEPCLPCLLLTFLEITSYSCIQHTAHASIQYSRAVQCIFLLQRRSVNISVARISLNRNTSISFKFLHAPQAMRICSRTKESIKIQFCAIFINIK